MDPNTLHLDPDPEFWPNLDSDPDPGPGTDLDVINFEEKIINNNFKELFFFKSLSVQSLNCEFIFLKSFTFCLYFILYFYVWIQIHKAPEYGSNTDPDLQHSVA